MYRTPAIAMTLAGLLFVMPGAASAGSGGLAVDKSSKASPLGPVTTICGVLGKYKVKTDDTVSKSTTSTSFVKVPNASMNITVSGTSNSCVIISFSALTWVEGDHAMFVQAVLDGSTIAKPGPQQFAGSDAPLSFAVVKSFDFIFPSVAPGSHTVKMQFRSNDGAVVYEHQHTLVAQYR